MKREFLHYDDNILVLASPAQVFDYADDHTNFSSHMNKSSWMMGGGKMEIETDDGKGQKVGSHIKMKGKVLGTNLFLDEVVTIHQPPEHKEWETVGDINLLVIGHYKLGFEIKPENENSRLRVFIDYEMPQSWRTQWLGYLFGGMYARWCVGQMIDGVAEHFKKKV